MHCFRSESVISSLHLDFEAPCYRTSGLQISVLYNEPFSRMHYECDYGVSNNFMMPTELRDMRVDRKVTGPIGKTGHRMQRVFEDVCVLLSVSKD